MSDRERITPAWCRQAKTRSERLAWLTAYDYPTARLLDEGGVPVLLVGDSLGMVVLGFPDTTQVTMEHMSHHVAAVAQAQPRALVVADLPYRSYETPEQAVANARRLIEAGADAVKLEGGQLRVPQVEAIRAEGIEVVGHLGMLPQSVKEEGGYRIKGKTENESAQLRVDASALEAAGVFAIVLELVVPETARAISQSLRIPTIGIGSGGRTCDGDVLVIHDLVGAFPWFTPKFVEPRGDVAAVIREAVEGYRRDGA
ncbi:MAG: 3-methyl-2-oxobutanoate hydroxymethyltransferase [Verrucomicrobiota bacterium]